jgi:hypothetical protein
MVWNSGPTMPEDTAAKFVEFALESDVEARAFKAKVEPADSAEKRSSAETRRSGGALARAALRRGSVGFSVGVFRHR